MASRKCLVIVLLPCLAVLVRADDRSRDHFKSGESSTTFPVQIHESLVYVPVEINGRPLQFVLDSGSSRNLVDTAQAKRLGLKVGSAGTLQGAGHGQVPMQGIDGLTIRIPGLEMYFDQASSVDLSPVNKDQDFKEDGLLGYPFLERYVVTIDYENKTMTVAAPGKFTSPAGAVRLPIEIRHGWPFVTAAVKPSEDVSLQDRFFIDSGSSDAVDHPIATKMNSQQPTATGVGLGTPTTGTVAKLWGFLVGTYLLRDVEVACCGSTEDTMRMFGGEILRRFTVTFDYPHQQMFLVPNRLFRSPSS
jgi:Aspartyl protease